MARTIVFWFLLISNQLVFSNTTTCWKNRIQDYQNYTSNEKLNSIIQETHALCPNMSQVHVLGHSTLGHEIQYIEFNERSSRSSVSDKIKVALIANMHGDEISGREILAWFMKIFCQCHQRGSTARRFQHIARHTAC